MNTQFLKIAHRGASGYEAENSLAALQKAVALEVDIIEADVQLTSDGIPIIRHDRLLDRTTNTKGYAWDYSWEQYQDQIRLKDHSSILSLQQFCEALKPHRQELYVDLKTFEAEALVAKICLSILPSHRILIGSFNAACLIRLKKIHPEIRTVLILEGSPMDPYQIIEHAQCDVLALGFEAIDVAFIKAAHEMGKKVFTWTVNHPLEIARAKALNVDGITSDYPDRI